MTQLFANNAKATLASSIASNATSIPLATGTGALFPSPTGGDLFKITFTQQGAESSWEIGYCTARSGDTLTVTRGQDGTSAAAWSASDKVELRLTASDFYPRRPGRNAQTGTAYTVAASDVTVGMVTLNNAAAVAVTIPPNSSVAITVDESIDFAQLGAGQVTFAPGAGVTLRATPGLKLRAQYSGATAKKIATDEWLIVGDLAA